MHTLPDSVRLESGRGGLRRLVVAAKQGEGEIYLHGGHVTHFQPRGQKPLLFMSGKSWFETGKPIRGGVPVCFPWFGTGHDGKHAPPHGFSRLVDWELASANQRTDGSVDVQLKFASTDATRRQWDADFEVDYRVTIGAVLAMEFSVRNTSLKPIRIEEALHTYLAVSDVRQVNVEGLANTRYSCTVPTPRNTTEGSAPIRIVEETDRIYWNTRSTCIVHDPAWKRRLVIEKTGSDTTVLWNPWIAKAKGMPDFGDDEWPFMLCIETCNVRDCAVIIQPGQTHTMTATVRAESE